MKKKEKRSNSDTSNCFHFVSFLALYSWENPKLHPLFPPVPCPLLTMSTHTHTDTHGQNTHSLECTDERLSTNDKVPRPLNTSKIELVVVVGGGVITPQHTHACTHSPPPPDTQHYWPRSKPNQASPNPPNVHLHLSLCITASQHKHSSRKTLVNMVVHKLTQTNSSVIAHICWFLHTRK